MKTVTVTNDARTGCWEVRSVGNRKGLFGTKEEAIDFALTLEGTVSLIYVFWGNGFYDDLPPHETTEIRSKEEWLQEEKRRKADLPPQPTSEQIEFVWNELKEVLQDFQAETKCSDGFICELLENVAVSYGGK